MKKIQVPATGGKATPAFVDAVKDNLEILTGLRNNRIKLPTIQTLTFSSTPTQAEANALLAYVNAWATALTNLMGRLDG